MVHEVRAERRRRLARPADATTPPSPVMEDVARAAGVSAMTVSRVLNDHPSVRAETRERVLAEIERLGYRRNSAARALATRRSQTLGVVAFDTTFYGPAACARGVEHAARESGFFVSLVSMKQADAASIAEACDSLVAQSVEGLVVVSPQSSIVEALRDRVLGVPMVVAGGRHLEALPSEGFDQSEGAARATRHLLDLGHATVHHVGGPPGWDDAADRASGWRATLADYGASRPPVVRGDWSAASGYLAGRRLLAHSPSAIFVANDQMALGVIRAIREAGRHVPEDVSVVGFDDIPEAPFFDPPLTTIRQDFEDLGRRSVAHLLDALGSISHRVASPAELTLIERSSTGSPLG